MRQAVWTLLTIFVVEFIVAPIGARVFDNYVPQNAGVRDMIPDIPFYHWGYATLFALGAVVGIAIDRWRKNRQGKLLSTSKEGIPASEGELLKQRRLMQKEERLRAEQENARETEKHPRTAEYDIPKKLAAIDQLLEIVGSEQEYEQLYRRGKEIARNWSRFLSEKGTDGLAADVEEFGEACNTMFHKIIEIRKANERYQDIWKMSAPTTPGSMSGAATKFLVAVRNLGTQPPKEFKFFMQPYVEQFETRLDEFGKWRFQCEKALIARRMELSG